MLYSAYVFQLYGSLFQINVIRTPHHLAEFMFLVTFVMFIALLRENGVKFSFLQNKHFWGVLTVLFCIAMCSGQMWNLIENPPFMSKSQDGIVHLIHRLGHKQYLFETYLVMVLSILLRNVFN